MIDEIPLGTVARLIQVATAEVGYIEKPVNITKYGEFMKADGLRLWLIPMMVKNMAGMRNYYNGKR